MKKSVISIVLISILLLSGCQHDDAGPAFESKILGNWLVVNETYDQSVVESGFFYVGAVKLYEDKTFKINVGDQDDPAGLKHGTWKYLCDKNSIVFYSYVNDFGTIYSDTTTFKISLENNEKLILENDWIKVLHKKVIE